MAVLPAEREIGRIGPLGLANTSLQFLSPSTTTICYAWRKARTKDGLSNSPRLFIEQQGKWQTINLRGHEF
jgi:hypothetical protein